MQPARNAPVVASSRISGMKGDWLAKAFGIYTAGALKA